ncbi:MAG: multicopper oxidase family protein [Leptolyngbya sp. BL-A-14]
MLQLKPFQDELPLPETVCPVDADRDAGFLEITAQRKFIQLHADLPAPTPVWSYQCTKGRTIQSGTGETFLGPSIEVKRADTVTVAWKNEIPAGTTLPYEVIKVNSTELNPVPQNLPGRWDAIPLDQDTVRKQAHNLQAGLVTHLHGGRTQADYDGWPDNTALAGEVAHYTYHNNQASTMLWYHDHAMHVTRLNVYAGLAGVWLIRDDEEEALNLPQGDYELPLVIQDRNLDVDNDGNFTGALLHKVEVNGGVGPAEFFGPYTLVNGKIWPRVAVEATLYRLRVLNGSNARTYRLIFLDENGNNLNARIWQIGSDQGLLPNKVPLPETGLILMSSERADLLLDFSAVEGSVYLWNTADAPFGNDDTARPDAHAITQELLNLIADPHVTAEAVDPQNADRRRLFPQVMRFDIGARPKVDLAIVPADPLRAARPQPPVDTNTTIRFMALVEEPAPDPTDPDATTMLDFWEFVPISDGPVPDDAEIVTFKFPHPASGEMQVQQCWKAATRFYDRVNWFIHVDATEVWYIVNLSGDSHPIHVHLVDFLVTQRFKYLWNHRDPNDSTSPSFDPVEFRLMEIEATTPVSLDPNIIGAPKDTVRVDPGQMVGITLTFAPYPGRYMYHCHILEHEDHDMMRPIVVVPKWVPHHNH